MGNSRIIITTQEDPIVTTAVDLPLEAGIVLETPRGPVGKPVRVTTEAQLLQLFGTPTTLYPVFDAVRSFVKRYNGINISRIRYTDAVDSSVTLTDGAGTPKNLVVVSGISHSDYENGYKLVVAASGTDKVSITLTDASDVLVETLVLPKLSEGFVNELNLNSKYLKASKTEDGIIAAATYTFAGGAKGSLFDTSEVIDAVRVFDTPFINKLDVVLAPGLMTTVVTETIEGSPVTHMPVIEDALALAHSRPETMVIADFAPAVTVAQINTNIALLPKDNDIAYYHPAIKQRLTSGEVVVPASMAALFVFAAAAQVSPWTVPAGFTSVYAIPFASAPVVLLSQSEVDSLYDTTPGIPSINPIIYDSELGFVIDGQRTADVSSSIQRNIGISRLAKALEYRVNSVSKKYQYRPNNETTWDAWKLEMVTYLNSVEALNGISAFEVFMGRNTMTADDIREGRLIGIIKVSPVNTVESIYITINLSAVQA